MTETEAAGQPLSAFDATMLVMGGIVGVGIFFTPHAVAQHLPAGPAFLGIWILGALVAMCGAFTFAEWGGSLPRAGGWYVFLREAFGPLVAFLFAWVILGVVTTGAIAVIASIAASNLARLVDWIGPEGTPSHRNVAFGVVIGFTGITLCGVKVGAGVQNLCMITKLLAIAALSVAGLLFFTPGAASAAPAAPPAPQGLGAWLAAAAAASLPVFFSYGGWQNVCYVAPQVRDPSRTLPRAIVLGVALAAVAYLLVNLAYLRVLGIGGLAEKPDVAAALARGALGARFERALAGVIAVSAFGVCAVTIIVSPGIYVAMARQGMFFASFGRLHPSTGAPVLPLLCQCAIALGYLQWSFVGAQTPKTAAGGFRMDLSVLTSSVVFAEWFFHGLAAWGLVRLRARQPDLPRPFRMPLWPWPALVYALVAVAIVLGNVLTAEGGQTLVGLTVLASGVVIYGPWRWLAARARS